MKTLRKYLEKREESIDLLLKQDRRSYDSETIHNLRIEIKKVNAFLRLIKFAARDIRRNKVFKPFKKIFHRAGKLRDLQVEEEMLKRPGFKNISEEYRKILKKKRSQEQKEFYSILTSKLLRRLKKAYREMYSFASQVHKTKVDQFLKKKRKQIEQNVAANSLETAHLHKLRKTLKEFDYNRDSVGMKRVKSRSVKANTLPILLGKWHDCQVMIGHLEKVIHDRQKYHGELNLLNRITKKVSGDRALLLRKIEKAFVASEFYRQGK